MPKRKIGSDARAMSLAMAAIVWALPRASRCEEHDAPGFRVDGTITTFDGAPLPGDIDLRLVLEAPGLSAHFTPGLEGNTFSHTFRRSGRAHLAVLTREYAPTFISSIRPAEDGIARVHIELEEGVDGIVQLETSDGSAIEGAIVSFRYSSPSGTRHPIDELESGSNGRVVLGHAPDVPLEIEVSARGYEWDLRENVRLDPSKPFEWTLRPALGTRGVVRSRKGEPVAGADVRLFKRSPPHAMHMGARGPVLATTDARGRFTLATLRRDTTYTVLIDADGHGALLALVSAGERLDIVLPRELRVRGTVTGDLSELSSHRGKKRLSYFDVWRSDSGASISEQCWADVRLENGAGRFEIRDPIGTHVRIDETLHALPENPDGLLDITVELGSADEEIELAKRRLRVRFTLPEGGPPIAGTVRVASHAAGDRTRRHSKRHEAVPIEDGQAAIDVWAPGSVEIAPSSETRHYIFDERDIDVPAGRSELAIEIVARRAGAIRGRVLAPDGHPAVRGVSLSCYAPRDDDGPRHNFDIGAEGRFTITPLELGRDYVVSALDDKVLVFSDAVSINAENPERVIELRLVEGVRLQGRVVDEEGLPVSNAMVSAHFEHPFASRTWLPGTRSTRLGYFDLGRFNPEAGTMRIRVVPEKDFRPRRATVDTSGRNRGEGEPVEIRLDRGRVLEGQVVDAESGAPLADLEVYAIADDIPADPWHDRYPAEGRTDEEGRFRFSTLPPFACRIRLAGGARFPPGTSAPLVQPGTTEGVTLRAQPSR